jgi:dienelactone hydrolase
MKLFVLSLVLVVLTHNHLAAPLPEPGGKHRVGTRLLGPIVDDQRPDARFASGFRTVVAQLWYPTSARRGTHAPYVPEAALIDHLKKGSSAPDVIEVWRSLQTRAILDAPIARGRFPVVFFLQGMGFSRAFYTSWATELASRGHVVVTIDHPDVAPVVIGDRIIEGTEASNDPAVPARRVAEMAADVQHVLATLLASPDAKHLNASRIAVTGHSIGGAAALEACRTSKQVTACADLDGSVWGTVETEGVDRPYLLILNEPNFPTRGPRMEAMAKQRREEWKAVIGKQTEPATLLLVSGTNHLTFSDAPFVREQLVKESGGATTDPVLVLRSLSAILTDYFARGTVGRGNEFITVRSLADWAQ